MPMPAKSARLTLLEGNKKGHYNKKELYRRAENEEKMKIKADKAKIVAPDWLSDRAKAEFNRLAKLLLDVEILTEADVNHLAIYCDCYDKYVKFNDEVNKNTREYGKPNRFIEKKIHVANQMRQYANDLGLSPAARAKLAINVNKDVDDKNEDF